MIIIHSIQNSSRLKYVVGVIADATDLDLEISDDPNHLPHIPRIHYGTGHMDGYMNIPSTGFLFKKGIEPVEPQLSCWMELPALFPMEGDIPFDMFSGIFFLVSRYEEYFPYKPDIYERFPHTSSTAFKNDFLDIPLVNAWLVQLINCLNRKFNTHLKLPEFKFIPTYDVDMAWSYRYKGVARNIAGFLKKPSLDRIRVNLGLQVDPFDSFPFINTLHERLNPIYFILVANSTSRLDKNISPHQPAMRKLISSLSGKYQIGLHPSWASNSAPGVLEMEKKLLEEYSGAIDSSRQHYLRFRLPETYRELISAGILNEYSMGYGTINGFRASISTSFLWYDLELEQETPLRIHPFCFMDANSHFEQGQGIEESFSELLEFMETCKRFHCRMITIFHNHFLGTASEFRGWQELYSKFISQVRLSLSHSS